MKIQFCSDLHLEMHQNQKWVKENPLIPNGDILIIAGDTDYLGSDFGKQDFFKKISDDFEQSYIIPGNHEYYGGFDISTAFGKTNEKLFDNVTLLNNDVVSYNEVQLIFSTMWSLIGRFKHEIVNAVADFRMITYKGQPLSTDRFNQLHRKSFEFIQKEASKEEQKIIILIICQVIYVMLKNLEGVYTMMRFALIKQTLLSILILIIGYMVIVIEM